MSQLNDYAIKKPATEILLVTLELESSVIGSIKLLGKKSNNENGQLYPLTATDEGGVEKTFTPAPLLISRPVVGEAQTTVSVSGSAIGNQVRDILRQIDADPRNRFEPITATVRYFISSDLSAPLQYFNLFVRQISVKSDNVSLALSDENFLIKSPAALATFQRFAGLRPL